MNKILCSQVYLCASNDEQIMSNINIEKWNEHMDKNNWPELRFESKEILG